MGNMGSKICNVGISILSCVPSIFPNLFRTFLFLLLFTFASVDTCLTSRLKCHNTGAIFKEQINCNLLICHFSLYFFYCLVLYENNNPFSRLALCPFYCSNINIVYVLYSFSLVILERRICIPLTY